MKPFQLLLFLCCSIVAFAQNVRSGSFSITDKNLLEEITASPGVDLSVAVWNGDGEPETRTVALSLEMYYLNFLRAVNQLKDVVNLKNDLADLRYSYSEHYFNKAALNQMAELTYHKAWNTEDYDTIFSRVLERYALLRSRWDDPALPVYDDFHYKREEPALAYKERMWTTAKKIMQNLSSHRNLYKNRAGAKEGQRFYHQEYAGQKEAAH
ncbi:MAG: hypothetical protein K0M63_05735 [Weeksellaceae bacterium]|nr:hypothetical protein [Weeksellaceae bacterium]